MRSKKTGGLTIPPSKIKDFCHLPLHKGGFLLSISSKCGRWLGRWLAGGNAGAGTGGKLPPCEGQRKLSFFHKAHNGKAGKQLRNGSDPEHGIFCYGNIGTLRIFHAEAFFENGLFPVGDGHRHTGNPGFPVNIF